MAGQGQGQQAPNWANIAQASTNIAQASTNIAQDIPHEIQRLPNVGVVQLGQQIAQLGQQIAELRQDMEDRMDIFQITFEEVDARLQHLDASAVEREERGIVRARNAGLKHHEYVEPILVNGVPPLNFPPTVGHLAALNGRTTDDILAFYGLAVNGNVVARRRRLARFLGVYLG